MLLGGGGESLHEIRESASRRSGGEPETGEEGARRPAHRRDVADVDGEGLAPDQEGGLAGPEMLAFQKGVRREKERAQYRSVVAGAERRRRDDARMSRDKPLEEPDLAEPPDIHPPSLRRAIDAPRSRVYPRDRGIRIGAPSALRRPRRARPRSPVLRGRAGEPGRPCETSGRRLRGTAFQPRAWCPRRRP